MRQLSRWICRHWILLGLCLGVTDLWAATMTTTLYPSSCVNDTSIGSNAWTNPGNAKALDQTYASESLPSGQKSNYLKCTGYGASIPSNATILGITVAVTRKTDNNSNVISDASVRLVKGGGVSAAADRATSTWYTNSDVTEAHGGASDLWGTTWMPADINASNFGAAFAVDSSSNWTRSVYVDAIVVTVNYSVPLSCTPPTGSPSGLTCVCDQFNRTNLNPSTIFGSSWAVSASDSTGVVPYINSGALRLTESTKYNAKAATVPAIFPALGNYISVEFRHYAYNGSGADGMAVTLSDYAVPAVPGAFGGSLGYAQKSQYPASDCTATGGCPGFAGGWLGMALDEFGNFSNPIEGRVGGPGQYSQSVTLRGSGSGLGGYNFLSYRQVGNIDSASSTSRAPGYNYQVIVDARNNTTGSGPTTVTINRDSGGGYVNLINLADVYASATTQGFTQAVVPKNWQISFTGSTGASTNIHEITDVRICSSNVVPPTGGAPASFNAIDESYSINVQNALQGHIFTKLAGTSFKLGVAALADINGDGVADSIQTTYAISGNKNVLVQLIDDSSGASCNASASACSLCSKPVIASQTLTFTSADVGFKTTSSFTVNSAYSKVLVRMCEGSACPGTTSGCSVDTFAIRPTSFSSVTTPASGGLYSAANSALTGAPALKAGTDSFSLTATANAAGYNGTPKINTAAMAGTGTGWVIGALTPTVFNAAVNSVATTQFKYSEVGNFKFLGYDPAKDATSPRGIYDDTWVAVDSGSAGDCVAGSYANTKDVNGKYGCLFGLSDTGSASPNSPTFGRFVPDHFTMLGGGVSQFCSGGTQSFTYMGQTTQPALGIAYRLEARNGSDVLTTNYSEIGRTPPYPVTVPALVAEDQTVANQGCDLASRLTNLPTAQWSEGQYAFNDTVQSGKDTPTSSTAQFSRPAKKLGTLDPTNCAATRSDAAGPFWLLDIGVKVSDPDGATMAAADMNADVAGTCSGSGCTAKKLGSAGVIFGRVAMNNASGSSLLSLPVRMVTEYYTGSGWALNANDTCSTLGVPTLSNATRTMTMTATTPTVWSPLRGGNAGLLLSAPGAGKYGSVTLTETVPAWLQYDWAGTGSYNQNPATRATFGTVGGGNPRVFSRENY